MPWRRGLGPESTFLLIAVIAFIAMTVWWLTQDTRVQDWDNGLHTLAAFSIHDQIAAGNLTGWFTDFNDYPPLAHLVGALGVFLAGKSPMAVIITSNVVFVPVLAGSCYGIGCLASGRRAGLLAGLAALGSPLFVSQMHVFMTDPPEAAMVAASVYGILASQRFRRLGVSALAGLLVGLAMMTKETSLVFLAGPVAMVLARGGYRNWRGLAAFLVLAAAVSLPWYIYHRHQLAALVGIHSSELGGPYATPPVLSPTGLLWYFWAAANVGWFVPLMVFLGVGLVYTLRDSFRRFRPENLGPELLAGLMVSWLGITLIRHKDVRYMLPAVVYVAVLATIWIPAARPRTRLIATTLVSLVLAANFLGISAGLGPTLRVSLPGASRTSLWKRELTFFSPAGYTRGGPEHDGNVLGLMRGLRRAGIRTVAFDPVSANAVNDFTIFGLTVRAIQAGLSPMNVYNPTALRPHDAFVLRHVPQPGDPPPCQRLRDRSGVYVELGNPVKPFQSYTFICPGRHPQVYTRTAPLSLAQQVAINPQITGPPRAMLAGVLKALHQRGVQALVIDHVSADKLFFQPTGIALLAEGFQLPVAWSLQPKQMTASQAFVFRRPIARSGPRPCGRFPDGTGLFIVLGDPTRAHPDYVCPLTRRP